MSTGGERWPWSARIPGLPHIGAGHVELGVSVDRAGRTTWRATYAPQPGLADRLPATAALLGPTGAGALLEAGQRLLSATVPETMAAGFAGWVGVSVVADRPEDVERVKVYANATHPSGGYDRLGPAWEEFAALGRAAGVPGAATARLAAVAGDRAGGVATRLYSAPLAGRGLQVATLAAAWCALDPGVVLAAVGEAGLGPSLWADDVVIDLEDGPDGRRVELHLATRSLGAAAIDLRARLMDAMAGPGAAGRALGPLGVDDRWVTTGVSLGFSGLSTGSDGLSGLERVNSYLLPPPRT